MLAVWWSVMGTPDTGWPESGRWTAQSPTLGTVIEYDESEAWHEAHRIVDEAHREGFPVGSSLYHQIPMYSHHARFIDPDALRWMRELRLVRSLHCPPAATLGQVPAMFADAVIVIEQEEAAAMKYRQEHSHG